GAAHQNESGDRIELIQKRYRDLDNDQGHHECGLPLVDSLEQSVQSEGHEDKTDLPDQFARDAQAKERFRSRDVAGRGGGVSAHYQLVGNVAHGEEAKYGSHYIEQAYESAGIADARRSNAHGSSMVRFSFRYGGGC